MAKDEATYSERHAKANANLAEKQRKMQEEADAKVKLVREDLSKDYKDKLAKQEEWGRRHRDDYLQLIRYSNHRPKLTLESNAILWWRKYLCKTIGLDMHRSHNSPSFRLIGVNI